MRSLSTNFCIPALWFSLNSWKLMFTNIWRDHVYILHKICITFGDISGVYWWGCGEYFCYSSHMYLSLNIKWGVRACVRACVCVCEIMSIYNENLWFYAHQNKLLTYSHFLLQTWGRMGAWESFAGTLGETMARNGGSTCPRMLQYVSSNLFSLDWFFLRQELRFLRVKKFSWKKIKCS